MEVPCPWGPGEHGLFSDRFQRKETTQTHNHLEGEPQTQATTQKGELGLLTMMRGSGASLTPMPRCPGHRGASHRRAGVHGDLRDSAGAPSSHDLDEG